MTSKHYLLFLATILAISSCNKTNNDDNQNSSERAFKNLTDKYFIRTDAVSAPAYPLGNGTSSTDIYHDWYKDPCVLDDLRMFKTNGDYIYDNGATKCDALEPQSATLQWAFIENNSKIEVTKGRHKDTLNILINDGTILKYESKHKNGSSSTIYIWTESWRVK